MPPILAFFIFTAFVVYVFRRDLREHPNVTPALWLPTIWMFLISSRTVTQWAQMAGISLGGGNYQEGTPSDAVVFFALITAGIVVLYRRHVNMRDVASHNRLLTFFLIYCLISICWSEFPFVAFKRWIKILGHPVMTLVVFTEPDPQEAICRMMKRCAYIILPYSIMFIKYFPEWSHENSPYGGPALLTGTALDKNMEGSICFILGAFFLWHFLQVRQWERSPKRRGEMFLCLLFLLMVGYLLRAVHSSTSEVSLAVAAGVMLLLGRRFINPANIGTYLITTGVVIGLSQWMFGFVDYIIQNNLGKDLTLTDRTKVWALALQLQDNPILGAGFESFWMGDRLREVWSQFWWHPIQAHNGYLETYLSLGLVGLGLMLALIVSAFLRGRHALLAGSDFGRFRLGFVTAFVLYNWTEAAFKAIHPVWFVFYIVAIDFALQTEPAKTESEVRVEQGSDRPGFEGEVVA